MILTLPLLDLTKEEASGTESLWRPVFGGRLIPFFSYESEVDVLRPEVRLRLRPVDFSNRFLQGLHNIVAFFFFQRLSSSDSEPDRIRDGAAS